MSEIKQRMSPAELREACICAAATAVVGYVLGYGYEDIAVHDDGEAGRRPCRTSTRRAGLLAMIRGRAAKASLSVTWPIATLRRSTRRPAWLP